jgi:microcystin-dependent protein
MTTPFLGEIQILGFQFAPSQWALANGATLQVRQYSALFSLIGTAYGGNGTTTFQLPNFANRTGWNQGNPPSRGQITVGEVQGENAVALTTGQMPLHNHPMTAYTLRGTTNKVSAPVPNAYLGTPSGAFSILSPTPQPNTIMANCVGTAGGNQPHENRQPYLPLIFAVALNGAFPSFN